MWNQSMEIDFSTSASLASWFWIICETESMLSQLKSHAWRQNCTAIAQPGTRPLAR